jgi:beta-galactosidase/beta-glucuronidase
MAHNPPSPARLDYMDRLGMVAMDENRDYGGNHGQGGTTSETVAEELLDMRDLIKRDRSRPSVIFWSFCNEVGCNNESAAQAFREVSKLWDPTRDVRIIHSIVINADSW